MLLCWRINRLLRRLGLFLKQLQLCQPLPDFICLLMQFLQIVLNFLTELYFLVLLHLNLLLLFDDEFDRVSVLNFMFFEHFFDKILLFLYKFHLIEAPRNLGGLSVFGETFSVVYSIHVILVLNQVF